MSTEIISDLSTLNRVRAGRSRIAEINTDAIFQRRIPASSVAPIQARPSLQVRPSTGPTQGSVVIPPVIGTRPTQPVSRPPLVPTKPVIPTIGQASRATKPGTTIPTKPTQFATTIEIPRVSVQPRQQSTLTRIPPSSRLQNANTAVAYTPQEQVVINNHDINLSRVTVENSKGKNGAYSIKELQQFARQLGLPVGGTKRELVDKIRNVILRSNSAN